MNRNRKPRLDRSSVAHYKKTYGSAPQGHGSWSFSLIRQFVFHPFSYTGSWDEAQAAAIEAADKLGCESVILRSIGSPVTVTTGTKQVPTLKRWLTQFDAWLMERSLPPMRKESDQ